MCKICEKFTQPRSFQPSIYSHIEFLNKNQRELIIRTIYVINVSEIFSLELYQILLLLTPLKIK